MVESSSPKPKKQSRIAENKSNPHKVKLVKSSKPLIYHKFYLDIEKAHSVAAKIESKIRELGGSIEFFFNKDVTHFVTDKEQQQQAVTRSASQSNSQISFSPLTPLTPLSIADSPLPASKDIKTGKQISRADAILLRARQQQQQAPSTPASTKKSESSGLEVPSRSPVQIARSWGRPVWTPEYTLKFLERVEAALKINPGGETGNRQRSDKVKYLRGDYLKIEAFEKTYRPFYAELKTWPTVNLKAPVAHGPFEVGTEEKGNESEKNEGSRFGKFSKIDSRTRTGNKSKTVGTIMTRKSRPQQGGGGQQKTAATRGGSEKQCGYCEICHVEYDVLKVHLKTEEHVNFAKNDDNFATLDRLIDSGVSVKNIIKLNGVKKKEEDDDEVKVKVNGSHGSPKMKRSCTKKEPKSPQIARREKRLTTESHEKKVKAARTRGLRWNAPSPDSRPPVSEPPVYKVDATEPCSSVTRAEQEVQKQQVVVKLKRVRQSELNLLNNEAEQFMFPKTPTYSESEETDDDRQTSEVHRKDEPALEVSSSPPKRRANRRPVEDKPGTKRRFSEAPIQPPLPVTNWSSPDDRMGDNVKPGSVSRWANFRPRYQSITSKFSFERVPWNEPWFMTFRRQDEGTEQVYQYFGNTNYAKLPYEMGPLPPPRDDCCPLEKLVLPKNAKGGAGTPRKRGGSTAYPRMPSIAKVTDRTRSSTAAIIEATKAAEAADDTDSQSTKSKPFLPLKKRKLFLDDMPRKSPREHPSTLAILSSMASGRQHRERLNSSQTMEDDENSSCTMTSQHTSQTQITEKDNSSVCSITNAPKVVISYSNYIKQGQQLEDMLRTPEGEEEVEELSLAMEENTPISCNIGDLSEIIDRCAQEELTLKSVNCKEREVQRKITYRSMPKLVTSGFRFNKKRRNNRTGWPARRKPSSQSVPKEAVKEEPEEMKPPETEPKDPKTPLTPDIFGVSSDSLDSEFISADLHAKEYASTASDALTEDEDEPETTPKKSLVSSRGKGGARSSYNRGKYQFEKFPKITINPVSSSNMKTRSSDLQKRKSITPKKYADESSLSTPTRSNKYSPRKLRKPRGTWYRER